MTRYFLPAASQDAAETFADAIKAGRIPCLPEYLDATLAAENFAGYGLGMRRGLRLWCIERRAVDDGYIRVARIVDTAGQIAAALVIVIGGTVLTALATLI